MNWVDKIFFGVFCSFMLMRILILRLFFVLRIYNCYCLICVCCGNLVRFLLVLVRFFMVVMLWRRLMLLFLFIFFNLLVLESGWRLFLLFCIWVILRFVLRLLRNSFVGMLVRLDLSLDLILWFLCRSCRFFWFGCGRCWYCICVVLRRMFLVRLSVFFVLDFLMKCIVYL